MIDGQPIDGVDPETGWVDEAMWERLDQKEKYRLYGIVQKMLHQKWEQEDTPQSAEGEQPTWKQDHDEEIKEVSRITLRGKKQDHAEETAWEERDRQGDLHRAVKELRETYTERGKRMIAERDDKTTDELQASADDMRDHANQMSRLHNAQIVGDIDMDNAISYELYGTISKYVDNKCGDVWYKYKELLKKN